MQYFIHFDPLTQAPGFYCDAIHGARTVWIADPDWQRPLTTITLQPGDVSPDGSQHNESGEPVTIELPDESAEPPQIEVPNETCLVPAEALEINAERYSELLAGQARGQLIVPAENGLPVLQDPPSPTTEQFATRAIAQRSQLLQQATQAIAPLQDAVDLGEATEAEEAALLAWKRYRIALNRIEQQPGYPEHIDWPSPPGDV